MGRNKTKDFFTLWYQNLIKMNINDILSFLGDSEKEKIANHASVQKDKVETALQGAIPAIVSALKGNTDGKLGLKEFDKAIENDHDGTLLNNLSSFLENPKQGNGKGILKHTMAARRTAVEDHLSAKTGVDARAMGNVLEITAPIVLSLIGKKKTENNLNKEEVKTLIDELYESNKTSSDDPSDNGLEVQNIAKMYINTSRPGIQGFMDGILGFQ